MEPSILTQRQRAVLAAFAKDKKLSAMFYLTGGTALAGFYLGHRLSEDLDFFSEHEFDVSAITVFFRKHKKTLGFESVDFQQSYNRNLFFLHFPDEVLKTEFTYFPFPRIEKQKKMEGMSVDSILDIAVNKLFTIYQRTAARDYIDLYCITNQHHWSVGELIEKAKVKFDWHIDPLQLGAQFMKAQTAKDMPHMITPLVPDVWRQFFREQAKQLKKNVLTK